MSTRAELALSAPLRLLNDCDCQTGTGAATPVAIENRPGLPAVAYRVGTHAAFKASLLAALSDAGARPALRGLTARTDDDFSIALLDAWATVADVLTFYQERIANESYLRTATERRSLLELVRAIGYELAPGVAAQTLLAFTVENAPGAPPETLVPTGTRAQSLPNAPDEKPQTFETVEEIAARPTWNTLRPRATRPHPLVFGVREAFLAGTTTGLKPGDALLLVGGEREGFAGSERWDFRRLTTVESDTARNHTRVTWERGLGSEDPRVLPAADPKIYTLRQHASVFGNNAPDWRGLPDIVKINYLGLDAPENITPAQRRGEWPNFSVFLPGDALVVDLDAVYPKIVVGGWLVLARPEYEEVYRVTAAQETGRADFSLTGKVSRLTLDGENRSRFDNGVRATTVFAQSERLDAAEIPLTEPVQGSGIVLDRIVDGFAPSRVFVVQGKRARVQAITDNLPLTSPAGTTLATLGAGDVLTVLAPATLVAAASSNWKWQLRRTDPATGTILNGQVVAPADAFVFLPADPNDALVAEAVTLKQTVAEDAQHTRLELDAPLANVYDRATLTVSANVAPATHGETVAVFPAGEALGSGDAGAANQRFALRQTPLTYVNKEDGTQVSTLEVRVNDLLWNETPTLFGRGPRERVFVTRQNDDGKTTVQFGDGAHGARLPSGRENVRAVYRKGTGREGNLPDGRISLLLSRPLGVKAVVNPLAATGGQDPETRDDARDAAPRTTLTLGRVVSLRDYEDFARGFAGVARALATATWNGRERGVFVSVAGPEGDAIPDGGPVQSGLLAALRASGDPHVPVQVRGYRHAAFRISATLSPDPAFLPENVLANAESALRARFGFAAARAFGQNVSLGEVVATLQNAPGVLAVDVNALHRADTSSSLQQTVAAQTPTLGANPATLAPGELLLLDLRPGDLQMVTT